MPLSKVYDSSAPKKATAKGRRDFAQTNSALAGDALAATSQGIGQRVEMNRRLNAILKEIQSAPQEQSAPVAAEAEKPAATETAQAESGAVTAEAGSQAKEVAAEAKAQASDQPKPATKVSKPAEHGLMSEEELLRLLSTSASSKAQNGAKTEKPIRTLADVIERALTNPNTGPVKPATEDPLKAVADATFKFRYGVGMDAKVHFGDSGVAQRTSPEKAQQDYAAAERAAAVYLGTQKWGPTLTLAFSEARRILADMPLIGGAFADPRNFRDEEILIASRALEDMQKGRPLAADVIARMRTTSPEAIAQAYAGR
jgi:hypothetical protein